MVALKSLGWGTALAVVGGALGAAYTMLFAGEGCCGLEGLAPMVVGLFVGAATGVVAPIVAAAGGDAPEGGDDRKVALALVGAPVVLAVLAGVLHAASFGIDMIPAGLIVGAVGGAATGLAWRYSRRRGLHATATGAATLFVTAAVVAVVTGFVMGFDAGDENSLAPELFFYLTMILPLQLAAPVSAALARPFRGPARSA